MMKGYSCQYYYKLIALDIFNRHNLNVHDCKSVSIKIIGFSEFRLIKVVTLDLIVLSRS